MRLWHWYTARRRRKADERRLAERMRDDASPWDSDPRKAIEDAGDRIAELNKSYDRRGW